MITAQTSTLDYLVKRWDIQLDRQSPIQLSYVGRNHLPALTRELGFTKGAEIGVWRGVYSDAFCRANPDLHMLCVDPWAADPDWTDAKNVSADFVHEAYRDACMRLSGQNATIVRQRSEVAVRDVPDGSLDFAYIDANHGLEAVTRDLDLWMPKVKQGGICAGHDFRHFDDKPYIHVIEAVTAFTAKHQIDPWFVLAADRTPSFLWVVQ